MYPRRICPQHGLGPWRELAGDSKNTDMGSEGLVRSLHGPRRWGPFSGGTDRATRPVCLFPVTGGGVALFPVPCGFTPRDAARRVPSIRSTRPDHPCIAFVEHRHEV